jgi:type I restriction enzyme S subunit
LVELTIEAPALHAVNTASDETHSCATRFGTGLPSGTITTPFKQTEVGAIPREWNVSCVGKEFDIQLGKMLDSERNRGIRVPYLGNRAVQWGRFDVGDLPTVAMSKDDLQRYRVRSGDLLVCEGGEVGRGAIWRDEVPECYYQKAIHRLRAKGTYRPELMLEYLSRWASIGLLSNYITQTSIAHLPKDKFETIPLPVPPPDEQRSISKALGEVDALIAALDRLIAKKRDLKQAILQALLSGRTRLPGFSKPWTTKKIGSFAECATGGTPLTSVPDYWGGDIRWMNSGELNLKEVGEVEGRITRKGLQNTNGDILTEGCVLIGLAGQGKTRGTAAINLVPLVTNQSIAAILPNGSFVSRFLYYNLDSRYEELRARSSGGEGRGALNLSIIRSVEVLMPEAIEQAAIAEAIFVCDKELWVLNQRRAKTLALKEGMMQQLLTGRIRLAT